MKSNIPFSKDERSLQHRLGAIAAVLVLTFLLGSLVIVLNHSRSAIGSTSKLGVYAGSGDGALFKLDAANGQLLWRFKTQGHSIPAPVTVANGVAYVSSLEGFVYALGAVDGKVKWQYQTNAAVLSSAVVANGVVYVGSSDGNLYALDAQKGSQIWRYHAGSATTVATMHTIVISNNVIYGSSYDGVAHSYLFALDAKSGSQIWQNQLNDQNFTEPQVVNGVIYIASWAIEHQGGPDIKDSYVYAFSAKDGSRLWRSDKVGDFILASPTVDNGVVYIGSSDNSLYAFKATNGSRLWRYNAGGAIYTSPRVANGVVYAGVAGAARPDPASNTNDVIQSASYIIAVDATRGSLIWQRSIANYTGAPFALFDRFIYVGSSKDDVIHALRITDGSEVWHYQDHVLAGVYTNAPITVGS